MDLDLASFRPRFTLCTSSANGEHWGTDVAILLLPGHERAVIVPGGTVETLLAERPEKRQREFSFSALNEFFSEFLGVDRCDCFGLAGGAEDRENVLCNSFIRLAAFFGEIGHEAERRFSDSWAAAFLHFIFGAPH
jgi:hypothetical protein